MASGRWQRRRPASACASRSSLLTVDANRDCLGSNSSVLSTSGSSAAPEDEDHVSSRRSKHVQWRRGKSKDDEDPGKQKSAVFPRRRRTRTESSRGSETDDEDVKDHLRRSRSG